MPENKLCKQIIYWEPTERRKKGRPKMEWQMNIHRTVDKKNLTKENCEDRKR